jgi:hypothetical protein
MSPQVLSTAFLILCSLVLYQLAVRDNYQTPANLLVTPEAGGHGLARTFLRYSPQQ